MVRGGSRGDSTGALVLSPFAALLAATATTAEVSASPPPSLMAHALGGGTLNPTAAGLYVGVRYRDAYERSENVLLDNRYVDCGVDLLLSATFRPAVFVEWLPLAILKLRLQYEFWVWSGAHLGLGHGLTFTGEDAPFDPETLEARQGEEDPNVGHRLLLQTTVQLKIWRIVMVDTLDVAGWYVHGGGPGQYYYDSVDDNLIRKGAMDGTINNRLLVGAIPWDGEGDAQLVTGPVYDYTRSISAGIERHRLSLLAALTPFHELWGVSKPTLILLGGINLEDRNRAKELFLLGGIRLEVGIL